MSYLIGMSLFKVGADHTGTDLDIVSQYHSCGLVTVSNVASKVWGAEDKVEGDE